MPVPIVQPMNNKQYKKCVYIGVSLSSLIYHFELILCCPFTRLAFLYSHFNFVGCVCRFNVVVFFLHSFAVLLCIVCVLFFRCTFVPFLIVTVALFHCYLLERQDECFKRTNNESNMQNSGNLNSGNHQATWQNQQRQHWPKCKDWRVNMQLHLHVDTCTFAVSSLVLGCILAFLHCVSIRYIYWACLCELFFFLLSFVILFALSS